MEFRYVRISTRVCDKYCILLGVNRANLTWSWLCHGSCDRWNVTFKIIFCAKIRVLLRISPRKVQLLLISSLHPHFSPLKMKASSSTASASAPVAHNALPPPSAPSAGRSSRIAPHSHIKGLGLTPEGFANTDSSGFIGQTTAREVDIHSFCVSCR